MQTPTDNERFAPTQPLPEHQDRLRSQRHSTRLKYTPNHVPLIARTLYALVSLTWIGWAMIGLLSGHMFVLLSKRGPIQFCSPWLLWHARQLAPWQSLITTTSPITKIHTTAYAGSCGGLPSDFSACPRLLVWRSALAYCPTRIARLGFSQLDAFNRCSPQAGSPRLWCRTGQRLKNGRCYCSCGASWPCSHYQSLAC